MSMVCEGVLWVCYSNSTLMLLVSLTLFRSHLLFQFKGSERNVFLNPVTLWNLHQRLFAFLSFLLFSLFQLSLFFSLSFCLWTFRHLIMTVVLYGLVSTKSLKNTLFKLMWMWEITMLNVVPSYIVKRDSYIFQRCLFTLNHPLCGLAWQIAFLCLCVSVWFELKTYIVQNCQLS